MPLAEHDKISETYSNSAGRLEEKVFELLTLTILSLVGKYLILKMVSFHNTINYLTTQVNNETFFEATTNGILF